MPKTMAAHSALFENQPKRRVYDEAKETWFFSVVDIVRVLTRQGDATVARKYWNKLKQRLRDEGSELVTNCHQLTTHGGTNIQPRRILMVVSKGVGHDSRRIRKTDEHTAFLCLLPFIGTEGIRQGGSFGFSDLCRRPFDHRPNKPFDIAVHRPSYLCRSRLSHKSGWIQVRPPAFVPN